MSSEQDIEGDDPIQEESIITSEQIGQKRSWSFYVPIVILIFLVYMLFSGGPHPLLGQAAPDFSLERLGDNDGLVTLSEHFGNEVVVLDFWATSCPPCREGLPILDDIAQEYADKDVVVYAVNIFEPEETVLAFVESINLKLDVLLDTYAETSDDYAVSYIPQTVIIDKEGIIQDIHVGVSSGFRYEITQKLDELLN